MQELYSEIVASDGLKTAFVEAMKADKLEDFLKAHDCEATKEEVEEYIETIAAKNTPIELSEDGLKSVTGGSFDFTESVTCTDETCECSNTCIRKCC